MAWFIERSSTSTTNDRNQVFNYMFKEPSYVCMSVSAYDVYIMCAYYTYISTVYHDSTNMQVYTERVPKYLHPNTLIDLIVISKRGMENASLSSEKDHVRPPFNPPGKKRLATDDLFNCRAPWTLDLHPKVDWHWLICVWEKRWKRWVLVSSSNTLSSTFHGLRQKHGVDSGNSKQKSLTSLQHEVLLSVDVFGMRWFSSDKLGGTPWFSKHIHRDSLLLACVT